MTQASLHAPGQAPGPAYDRDKLVELFGDDPRTLAEVEREFLDTARVAEREIKGTDDFTAIARAAHRLKGASGMIGAAALRRIAEAVDQANVICFLASSDADFVTGITIDVTGGV